ncbi:DUF2920 family protein [Campylobacter sp. M4]|uniref:DUF2920 family protein n=1 Tax=Campylobacter sp. M4 TaxID=3424761 RepID=UPI003D3591AC
MIVSKTYEIPSCDDVELGIKRSSLLEFKLSYEDSKEIEAIIFIVPGLGDDADINYREHLAEFVASEFNVAVASVNYHCIGNRPQTGSTFFMDEFDRKILSQECQKIGVGLTGDMSALENFDKMYQFLTNLDSHITQCKQNGSLSYEFIMHLPLTLAPTKNEYQNYGIMQAQDLINALLYIKSNIARGGGKNLPCVMIGSSHGGYLVNMAAKIAPWQVDGVIDNSSYAIIPWRMIGFGKEIDYVKYCCFCAKEFFENIFIYGSDKTMWTLDKSSAHFFSQAHEDIRNVLNLQHLKEQSKQHKPIYVGYHCGVSDFIAPPQDKIKLYNELKNLGFDATLHLIKDQSEVDGRFIKNLTHGMGMSYKELIKKELALMLEKISKQKQIRTKKRSISYISDDLIYKFAQKNNKIELKISKISL